MCFLGTDLDSQIHSIYDTLDDLYLLNYDGEENQQPFDEMFKEDYGNADQGVFFVMLDSIDYYMIFTLGKNAKNEDVVVGVKAEPVDHENSDPDFDKDNLEELVVNLNYALEDYCDSEACHRE